MRLLKNINKDIFFILKASGVLFLILISNVLFAKSIKMSFGNSLAPYVIATENSGLEVEIIKAALQVNDYVLQPYYMPLSRVAVSLVNNEVDASQRSGGYDLATKGFFAGNITINYRNCIIALNKPYVTPIKVPESLKGKSLIAFQGAQNQQILKPWIDVVKRDGSYKETNNQINQVQMLFIGRVNYILADINIVNYIIASNQLHKKYNIDSIRIFDILPASNYMPYFTDKKVMQDFNNGLQEIINNGVYDKIITNYNYLDLRKKIPEVLNFF